MTNPRKFKTALPRMRSAVAAFTAAALLSGAAAAEPIALRVAFIEPDSDPVAIALKAVEAYVEEKLPGQIDIQLYPNGSLVSQSRLLPALQRGNIEAATFAIQRFAKDVPVAAVFGAGFVFKDASHLCSVTSSEAGRGVISAVEEKMGFKEIGVMYNGARHLALRKEKGAATPQDVNGLKIRTPGSVAWLTLGRALGGNPTPVQLSEMYLAMQTGTVDGFEGSPSYIVGFKMDEVTEELVLTSHIKLAYGLWLSGSFWDKLTDEQKAVLEEASDVFAAVGSKARLDADAAALELLRDAGMTMTEPDLGAFASYASDVYADSDLTKEWPEGLYDSFANSPVDASCAF